MPRANKPRKGSMQYWPRKRAKREIARVRSWAAIKDIKPLGFAGYKVGMKHAMIIDNKPTSITKGQEIFCPITIIECPPIKTASIKFYKNTVNGLKLVSEIFSDKVDKELKRKLITPKSQKSKISDVTDFDDIKLLVYTQPKLTGIGKKKPEVFEIAVGGNKEDKLKYAKEILGKEINVKDVFKGGQQLDTHAVTKGKGFQGPIKRFGISLRSHKSEKTKRGPGSLGSWRGQGHMMYRVAHAGRMGYNTRTDYNKWILKIDKDEKINPKGGFTHYGIIKNSYILVKGSVAGPAKRLIRFNLATKPNRKIPSEAPTLKVVE